MTKVRFTLFLIVLLCACTNTSGPGPSWAFAMRDVQFPMRDFRFPSGLRVLVEEDHRMPLVAIASVIGVGSTSDPAGKEGLAHYVEHLTFRSKPDGKTTIENLLAEAGAGAHNASTAFDQTIYYSIGPKEALGGLLLIEAGRLQSPVENITPEAAAVEREVVRNELRVRGETGFIGAIVSQMQAAVFPANHSYSRKIAGTHASLSSITPEDARAFAKAHYRPDNTTIVITGDVTLATVAAIVEESIPAELRTGKAAKAQPRMPPVSPVPPAPPERPAGGLDRTQANVPTPELWIGWSLPRGFDADSVLLEAVTRAARSTLPRAFRSDGDISNVRVSRIDGKDAAMLLCEVDLRAGSHPERSLERVLDQLVRMWQPPSGTERTPTSVGRQLADVSFGLFQRTIVTSMLSDAESLVGRAEERALATHFAGDPLVYSRKLKAAMELSAGTVANFANQYLTRDRARAVLFTPTDHDPGEPVAGAPPDAGLEPPAPAPDMETMRAFARPLGASAYLEEDLPNGLKAIVGARRGLPVVTVGVSFRTGESAALGADRLTAMLAEPQVTTKVVPGQFGASYGEQRRKDDQRYFMSGSSGNVTDMLALLSEWISGMKVDSSSADFFKREVLASVGAAEQWPEAQARRDFWSILYPSHLYGRTALAADLAKLDAGKANDWIAATHTGGSATVVVIGEVDEEAVMAAIRSTFGGLSPAREQPAPPAPALPAGAPTKPTLATVDRASATQLEIAFGCLLPPPKGSLATQDVAATLFQARIHDLLRRKLGASYGMRATAIPLRGGATHLALHGAVDNAHAQQAMAILRDALDALSSGPVDAAELDRARWARAIGYEVQFQATSDITTALLDAQTLGLTRASIDRYPGDALGVSAAAATSLFRVCAAAPKLIVTGKEDLARSAFNAAWP